MNDETQNEVSQAEFARLQGWDRSYVTQLKKADRLVMSEDSKRVVVDASLELIKKTEDPARQDVKDRHENERGGKGGQHDKPAAKGSYNEARTRRELAEAEQAEMAAAKMRGTLVNADEVRLFAADIGATFRAALETLPDRLAPELVALKNVDDIRAALVENFEELLGDLSIKLEKGVES